MDQSPKQGSNLFPIDPQSVADARARLREMVEGMPIAEAAVEGFSDWQVIAAMERLWAAGVSEPCPPTAGGTS